jgi:hypothetical protein
MEVDPAPNIVSDRVKAVFDDPQWPEHINDMYTLTLNIRLGIHGNYVKSPIMDERVQYPKTKNKKIKNLQD